MLTKEQLEQFKNTKEIIRGEDVAAENKGDGLYLNGIKFGGTRVRVDLPSGKIICVDMWLLNHVNGVYEDSIHRAITVDDKITLGVEEGNFTEKAWWQISSLIEYMKLNGYRVFSGAANGFYKAELKEPDFN